MKQQLLRYIRHAIPAYFCGLTFLTPLFFGTFTADYFDFNKSVLIIGSAALLLILWLLRLTLEGRLKFRQTALDIPLLLLVLVLLTAGFFSLNRLMSFTRSEIWLWISGIVLYFTYTNNRNVKSQNSKVKTLGNPEGETDDVGWDTDRAVIKALKVAGAVLAVTALARLLGLNLPNYKFDDDKSFTPIGNILSLDIFLATLLIFELSTIKKFFIEIEEKTFTGSDLVKPGLKEQIYTFLYFALLILALITVNPLTVKAKITPLSPGPSLATSWQIASEIVRERPLLGVGPGLYSEAFAIFKPFSFNNSANWDKIFPNAGSVVFHLISVTGLSGLLALLLIFLVATVTSLHQIKEGVEILPLATIFLSLSSFFSFWNPPVLFLFFLIIKYFSLIVP